MRRRTLKAHALADELCRQEKISYERVRSLSDTLLQRYALGQSKPLESFNSDDKELITKKKQEIRRQYVEIISGVKGDSATEYADFIWKVVRCRWFRDKVVMILDQIEEMIDGQVSDYPYDPQREGEHNLEGKQIRTILWRAYLDDNKNIKSPIQICVDMEISKATYDRRLPDAVVLFGILMWIYANKREREDIEAGIVEKPDYYIEMA